MKKFFIIIFFVFFSVFSLWAEENDKKQIKVLIEGVEETKEHQEVKPYIIWEKYDKKAEEQKLKDIAVKSRMEGEILDAVIIKLVELESKVNNLEKILIINIFILFICFIIVIFMLIKKR